MMYKDKSIFSGHRILLLIKSTESTNTYTLTKLGGSDKMQNLDLGLTHKTGGAYHNINDFCFLKFFISMKFDPSQGQKMIFC